MADGPGCSGAMVAVLWPRGDDAERQLKVLEEATATEQEAAATGEEAAAGDKSATAGDEEAAATGD
ncbi:hypothetical protein [Actinoplanes missouriensis]|uniref:hypothetical protein n=1 Tax=Actinoplanes missouriensis TaxID=1866 RepID=UPI0012F89D59|nr:hypothetical protein [Actinoplanes missouriensis]